MKWMRHQPQARMKNPPQATINYHGDVLFNVKTVRQIINKSTYVEIFFDRSEGIIRHIGFRFEERASLGVALKLQRKTADGRFSQARTNINREIAEEIGIRRNTVKKFSLEFETESGIWFIDVTKGELVDTSTYCDGHKKQ